MYSSLKLHYSICVATFSLFACQNKGALTAEHDPRVRRDTSLVLEECNVEEGELKKSDADGDNNAEITSVISKGLEVCRSADLNFDGRPERVTFYDANGKVRRIQSDYDREGRVDEVALYESGIIKQKLRVTTADGKIDTWEFYEEGELVSTERDENGDGIIDQWWEYSKTGCPVVHVDANRDGRPDLGGSINYCPEEAIEPEALALGDEQDSPALDAEKPKDGENPTGAEPTGPEPAQAEVGADGVKNEAILSEDVAKPDPSERLSDANETVKPKAEQ